MILVSIGYGSCIVTGKQTKKIQSILTFLFHKVKGSVFWFFISRTENPSSVYDFSSGRDQSLISILIALFPAFGHGALYQEVRKKT